MTKPTIIVEGRWYRMDDADIAHVLCIEECYGGRYIRVRSQFRGEHYVNPDRFRRHASPPYRTRREAIAGRED